MTNKDIIEKQDDVYIDIRGTIFRDLRVSLNKIYPDNTSHYKDKLYRDMRFKDFSKQYLMNLHTFA
jgi:hypothetical protein